MLKITRIHVKNFLSFKECTFELEDLQLLIGPNNSGKTNLFRVFEFLGKITDNIESHKIDLERNRFQHRSFDRFSENTFLVHSPIEISVEFQKPTIESRFYYKIELFRIQPGRFTGYQSSSYNEMLGVSKSPLTNDEFNALSLDDLGKLGRLFDSVSVIKNNTEDLNEVAKKFGIENTNQSSENASYLLNSSNGITYLTGNSIALGLFLERSLFPQYPTFINVGREFKRFTKGFIIYKPDPYYIKQPLPVENIQQEESLTGNCDNIVSYLENLLISDPERFNWINKELKKCIPDFTSYNFETLAVNPEVVSVGGSITKNVRYLRLKDRFGISHFANDISDGTLYFLMLLAIIHQKNMPSILMLEEPETGIHPRRIGEIMEYLLQLREQYTELSIIVTTHHPYLVDMFSNMPDRVWVFDSVEGESIVKNLERDIIEPSNEKMKAKGIEPIDYTSSLGEHWVLGFLGGVPKPVDHRPKKDWVK